MPYKSEKIKLSKEQDRRVKLTTQQREEIGKLYATGCYSLNDLAKMYEISKKTVLLIVNKDSAERAKEYRKEHWQEWARKGKEHAEAIKKTRQYKQELYKAGKLKEEKQDENEK